jgi:hypothetical protein
VKRIKRKNFARVVMGEGALSFMWRSVLPISFLSKSMLPEVEQKERQVTAISNLPIIREGEQGERTFLSETWYQVWKATGETTNGVVDTWCQIPHA